MRKMAGDSGSMQCSMAGISVMNAALFGVENADINPTTVGSRPSFSRPRAS